MSTQWAFQGWGMWGGISTWQMWEAALFCFTLSAIPGSSQGHPDLPAGNCHSPSAPSLCPDRMLRAWGCLQLPWELLPTQRGSHGPRGCGY